MRSSQRWARAKQPSPADAIFYVHKGIIKLTVISSRGREAVIAILGAGGFFGEGCLGGQVKRMSTATAMSLASVTRIEKAAVSRVLDDEPAFMELFLNWALSATTATSKFIVRCGMSFCTTEFRPEPRRRSAPVAVMHAPRFCQQNQCLARQM
jgi:CRP-like cAMP-binding protein